MDAHSPQTQPHKTNTDTPPRRVTEVTWCGLCKVCLLADGAQVSRGRGDKHTTETQVSHPLALTTLTAGAHSAHTQDRFPPALCYTQEHSCLIAPEESGTITTHMQQTTTLSQGHTHIDTQIHADSSRDPAHTHRSTQTSVCTWGLQSTHTHPRTPTYTDPLCKPAPQTAMSPGTVCRPGGHTPPPAPNLHVTFTKQMPGLSMEAAWHLLRGSQVELGREPGETPGLPGGDGHPVTY